MMTPAEFGESCTSSLRSAFSGTSPKARPSMRMYAHLRSSSHGTWSDGPMCTSLLAISCGICEVTKSDVHVALGHLVRDLRGDRLRLGDLLGHEALALQHVHEVH